jgi:hypothetical protein
VNASLSFIVDLLDFENLFTFAPGFGALIYAVHYHIVHRVALFWGDLFVALLAVSP